jgi:DNA mismatch endonuclease (patch repair protein)
VRSRTTKQVDYGKRRKLTNSHIVKNHTILAAKGEMKPPTEARRRIMRAVRSRDTRPELLVRSLAHRMGFRFRVCRRDLPGCPDLVFPRFRKVIFVHGCFWHGHDCGKGVRIPTTNRLYWKKKITRNQKRDKAAETALITLGWRCVAFWECQLKDTKRIMKDLRIFLSKGNR